MFYVKKYFKFIVAFGCLIVILVGGFICSYFFKNNDDTKDDLVALVETTTSSDTIVTSNVNNFYIDVKGEVKNPGVYFVSEGMIVEDAINLAGGLTKNAYTDNINLSLNLSKEMVIYIYNKKDITTVPITTKILNDVAITSSNSNVTKSSSSSASISSESTLVNINTASREELLTLPGIGEGKADKIISYRESNKFNTIEDIKNVSGIGDSVFESIKDYITV